MDELINVDKELDKFIKILQTIPDETQFPVKKLESLLEIGQYLSNFFGQGEWFDNRIDGAKLLVANQGKPLKKLLKQNPQLEDYFPWLSSYTTSLESSPVTKKEETITNSQTNANSEITDDVENFYEALKKGEFDEAKEHIKVVAIKNYELHKSYELLLDSLRRYFMKTRLLIIQHP